MNEIIEFSEFPENDERHSLTQAAKDLLQVKEHAFNIYRIYKPVLFGLSLKHTTFLTNLNYASVASCSPQSSEHDSFSKRPETTNQAILTPVKTNPNAKSLQRKVLTFENADNEASQNVTASQEKQSSPLDTIQNVKEPDALQELSLSYISAQEGGSPIFSSNQEKQLSPVKVNRISTESEILSHKNLLLGYNQPHKAELAHLEPLASFRRQTVIVSPKKIDRTIFDSMTEVDRKYITPTFLVPETVGDPEADNRTLERTNKAITMSTILDEKVKKIPSPYKELAADGVWTIDDKKSSSPGENVASSVNQTSISPAEVTTEIVNLYEGEKNTFCTIKKAKISNNPARIVKDSDYSDSKAKMHVLTYQDGNMNIIPDEGINVFKNYNLKRKSPSPTITDIEDKEISPKDRSFCVNFGRKSKSLSPRRDTVQCLSTPRIMQSSEAVNISCISTQNPSPTTSISSTDYTSVETITENKDKEKLPKDTNISVNFEGKKKLLSPKRDAGLCLSMPRIIQSPGAVEIVDYNPCVLKQKSSPISLVDFKSVKTMTDKDVSSTDRNFSVSFEGKRKSLSPKSDTPQCRSVPKIIHSSIPVEIVNDMSCVPAQNPSLTTSPLSSIHSKNIETITDKKDEEKSPTDINFSVYKEQPGNSRNASPSAKCNITGSPPVVTNTNSPIVDDVVDQGKKLSPLSHEDSKINPSTNRSPVSSPRIHNMDSKTFMHCITQFESLISVKEDSFLDVFNCLLYYRHYLEFLCHYLQVLMNIVLKISSITADYISGELLRDIFGLIRTTKEVVKKLGTLKTDVVMDIQYWLIYFQRIRELKSQNEPLFFQGIPLVTIDNLHAYEDNMKKIWGQLDTLVKMADRKRKLLLTTELDFQKSIQLFMICLMNVGILKPYLPPSL